MPDMATLSEYLALSGVTLTDLAKQVGVSKGHMSEILNGTRTASLPVALRIHSASGRVVALDTLVASKKRGPSPATPQPAPAEKDR